MLWSIVSTIVVIYVVFLVVLAVLGGFGKICDTIMREREEGAQRRQAAGQKPWLFRNLPYPNDRKAEPGSN
jgi:hypothetical protein